MRLNIRKIFLLTMFFAFTFTLHPSPFTLMSAYAGTKGADPVAYWRFDEGGGATAYDDTANNNDGTLYNHTKFVPGKIGKAVQFDGTDDYVNCGSGASLNISGPLTMEAWVYHIDTDQDRVITKAQGSTVDYSIILASQKMRPQFRSPGGVWKDDFYSNTVMVTNTWYHIAVTFERPNIKVYLNGQLDGSTTWDYDINTNGSANTVLGVRNDLAAEWFNGKIDDVRIYNYSRTADQIKVDYNAGSAAHLAAGTDPNEGNPPAAYWTMDLKSGNTLYDVSGNGKNGTITEATQVAGKYGSALSFDGSNDKIDVGDVGDETESSFAFWFKPNQNISGSLATAQCLLGKDGSAEHAFRVVINTDGKLGTGMHGVGIGSGDWIWTTQTAWLSNEWYHVAVTQKTNDFRLYINGIQVAQDTVVANMQTGQTYSLYIGTNWYATGNYFSGLIDDFKIYNYARTPAQIAYDYNKGMPVAHYRFDEGGGAIAKNDYSGADSGAAPVGWWRMDQASWNGTANEVIDSSGNGNHGVRVDNATTSSSSKIGPYCGTFDGTGDYVNVGTVEGYSNALTVEAWVNHSAAANWDDIVAGGCGDILFGFNSNQLSFGGQCNSPFGMTTYTTNINGAWHHVAGVYNGSTAKVYVDGMQVASSSQSGSFTPGSLSIGGSGASEFFTGKIDDVRIYNYARTPEQIYNDYKTTHGTLVGDTKFVDGKIGKALQFDGTGDYVNCGKDTNFNITGAITVEAWIKTSTAQAQIVGKADWSADTGYFMYLDGSSHVRFNAKGGGVQGLAITPSTYTDGVWHHCAGTYIPGTSVNIYIDGVLKNSVTSGIPSSIDTVDIPLLIGANDELNVFFNGLIDDVRIYNYSRTASQVMEDYTAGASRLGGQSVGEADPWGGALPVAYWRMDENTGVLAQDASGNGNNGTLTNGPTWTQGKNGPCLKFDGTNDYVDVGNGASLRNMGSAVTVEAWVKYNAYGGGGSSYSVIAVKGDPWTFLLENQNNKINFRVTAGGVDSMAQDSVAHELNRWYHFAGTYDGVNIRIYKDGVQVGITPRTGALAVNDITAKIGTYQGTNYNFNGLIDDVRIYNYARTQAQIAWDYNKGQPVAYWRFDETSGTTAYDDSDNNNDGTITIGATGTQANIAAARTNGATGKFGRCLSLDGTDDNVTIPYTSSIGLINKSFAVSAWVKPSASPPAQQCFFGAHTTGATDQSIHMRIYSDGSLRLGFYGDDLTTAAGLITFGEWYHVVMTYDYDSDNCKIYLNGAQKASGANGPFTGASPTVTIGDWQGERFKGLLEDVRIYNYARTAAQVMQDYNAGAATRLGD